ncbi:uncharacterized protein [Chironomus tepperi]|uniref:uncharacterized protein n=1 Tax=Chironomus tepperi TaxID=113505 RepID=UPI00391F65D3
MILFGIIFVNLIIFDTAKCQRSCSDIANFYSDNNGIYGLAEFFNVPIQQENLFKIELSVAARLPNGNGGSVDMLNQDAYNDILNGRKIILKFIPEIANPLPVVSGVFLNGNRICSSPPATGRTVSTITLSFTYTISGLPQITSTNFQSNYNPPFYYPNQETTKIIYKQPTFRTKPPIKQAKPIILTTLSHAPSKQTTQFQINNKLGNINNGQSYVCGVRRDSSSAVSFVIGGITGKYFIMIIN